jgi:23S rRNA (cytidine1920-2'-O)/16S rRNA (cytidine1409-2'-O)-methyltransferase
MKKERLDILVQRQAGVTRSKAQGIILAGNVLGPNGEVLDKPGARFVEDAVFAIREEPRYVSRGGQKLEEALGAFHIHVAGAVAIDVGASTGGFTDCLLQHGAARVYAVDVGYGQLAWKLRQDPRVVVIERTNIRHLTPDQLPERPNFFTADCSFISLQLVLPPLKALLTTPAQGVVLIKPQFEAGKRLVGKGGVVRDAQVHAQVVDQVLHAAEELGFRSKGVIPSSLLGAAGNREFLAHLVLSKTER